MDGLCRVCLFVLSICDVIAGFELRWGAPLDDEFHAPLLSPPSGAGAVESLTHNTNLCLREPQTHPPNHTPTTPFLSPTPTPNP